MKTMQVKKQKQKVEWESFRVSFTNININYF